MNKKAWEKSAKSFYDKESILKKDYKYCRIFCRAYRKLSGIIDLNPLDLILDAGCGSGEMSLALKDSVKFYCGVDISKKSLKLARLRNTSSSFVCADMTSLPISTKFNCILAMTSLEFVYDKKKTLKDFFRLLSDSGHLYVEVRNADFILFRIFSPIMKYLIKLRIIIPYKAEEFVDLKYLEWKKVLDQADFKIIREKKSIRPAIYGKPVTIIKNLIIKIISFIVPVSSQYMVGFLCVKKNNC